jgi:hypothetical protein
MYIIRNKDVVSNNEDLEKLFSFNNFPAFNGCNISDSDTDIKADLTFCISKSTGMIQVNPVLDPNIVYQSSHGSGNIGGWLEHHQAFADFISKYNPTSIFEIGGASGILNAEYILKYKKIPWTILELNPTPVENSQATWIKGSYNKDTIIENIDMVVHSHCLEHIYEPAEFFKNTLKFNKNTKMCFSIPNLQAQLEKKYTNILNFEHTYFCNESVVDYWLKIYGFEILEKNYYKDDHSIFYATIKINNYQPTDYYNQYNKNKDLFQNWLNHHTDFVNSVNQALLNSSNNVFLFGASINTQFLINLGIDQNKIIFVLDNDVSKQDKRLYGTNLIVKNPSILKNYVNPTVILKSGVHNKEIKNGILDNFNNCTNFIE